MQTNLKRIRLEKCLTQQQVAERAGITVRNYQSIEKGTQNPRATTALLIANALNTTVEELFENPKKQQDTNT